MPVLGGGRMIPDPVVQIEATEPTLGEVQMHLFTQPLLGANAKAISDQ